MKRHKQKPPKGTELTTWTLVGRLARNYVQPFIGRMLVALLFMAVSAAMTAVFAKLIEPILDEILSQRKTGMIVPMALAVFACFFVRGIATYIHTVIMNKTGQRIVAKMQSDMFSGFLDLDLGFFHAHPSGQLTARIINDVNVVRNAVTDTFTGFGKSLLTLVFLVALMFYQDWRLSLIAFTVLPFAALFVTWIGRRLRKVSGGIQTEIASLSDILTQIFQGIRQVKAYGRENFERARADDLIDRLKKQVIRAVRLSTLSTPFNETLLGFAMMGLIIYGGYEVAAGRMTTGELMSFIAAFSLAYEPMKKLAKLNNTLQMGLGAAERVFDMQDRKPTITEKPGATVLDVKKADIVFENVVFSYGIEEGQALNDISFKAPAGKVTALVGPSGSGKTTALNLVPRFYDMQQGRIMIGGHDIRDVTLRSLRNHIALVSQDITIFDETVCANIAYGREGATDEEIKEAAVAAAADDFIRELPEGYDTRLGEHGVKLSGGQRQRLSIARAILRNAPILLLDEATSALDTESEKLIQNSLQAFQKGRTVLVIAHRLSTVQHADQILVLDHGKIVETGTHESLLAGGGLYARMYSAGLRTS